MMIQYRKKGGNTVHGLAGLMLLCCLLLCGCGMTDPGAAGKATEEIRADTDGDGKLQDIADNGKDEESVCSDGGVPEDAADEKTEKEVLEQLMSDAGFRQYIWNSLRMWEEDTEESILRKLEQCEELTIRNPGNGEPVFSLVDLRLLPNLRYLVIHFDSWDESRIDDFSPIRELTHLESLSISYSGEEETDLSFLAEMHTIKDLFLEDCRIRDFSFLEEMPQLRRLSLYRTPIEDLSILERLPELVELTLVGIAGANHMEAVGNLEGLEKLGLQDCGIEDVSFLKELKNLRELQLSGNSISDISPLRGMIHLERLKLSANMIEDISVLAGMPELFELDLEDNLVCNISPLKHLVHLNQVDLADNMILDLKPLAGKEELMYVRVSRNPIQDLKPVLEVPMLYFRNWGVADEDQNTVARFMEELCPEIMEYTCVDYVEGDLDGNGLTDVAFIAESEQFDGEWEEMCEDRRLFILLQQKKGSFQRLEEVPYIDASYSGGMRGEPYKGIFMGKGYFVKKTGWGSRDGCEETEIYRFHQGRLELSRHIFVYDDNYAVGYDVDIQEGDSCDGYLIACDGYRLVKMVLGSSEDPVQRGFPKVSLENMSFYIHHEKLQTNLQPADALELFHETVPGAVREELAYADWQKENYELLFGVELPEYYYVVPGGEASSDDCFYYNGLTDLYGEYYHRIQYIKNGKREEYLIRDATGEINAS